MNHENKSCAPTAHTRLRAVIYALIIACFSAYLAFPSTLFAGVTLVLFLFCIYKISTNAVFVGVFAVCAILCGFLPLTFVASAVCLIASAAAGGAMLSSGKKAIALYVATLTAAFGLCLALSRSFEASASTLAPLPTAVGLAVCSKKKLPRVSAVCIISAILLATFLIPAAFNVYAEYGTDVGKYISDAKENFNTLFAAALEAAREISESAGLKLGTPIDTSVFANVADIVFPLIPSVAITAANLIAFAITFIYAVTRNFTGFPQTREETLFKLSSPSAWIYIISLISLLFSFGKSRTSLVFAMTMANINIILTPAFALIGAAVFIMSKKRTQRRNPFKIILIILGFVYFGVLILYPIALFGAITALKVNKQTAGVANNDKKE